MSKKHDHHKKDHHKNDHSKPFFKPKPPKSSVQHVASNKPVKPRVTRGSSVIKTPVVLTETTVQIDLDSFIDFPEPVLEIKDIKKNLKLTQCRLLLPTNKLFLKGFVRKNIQYATPQHGSRHSVQSKIKSLTVDVPFQTVTELDYMKKPVFDAMPGPKTFSYFNSAPLPEGYPAKENLLSGDLSQFNQVSGEVYNELPFCELISSHFVEYDEALDRKMGRVHNKHGKMEAPFEEGTFTKIEEKMVIEVTLKVLQNQQLRVNDDFYDDHDDH